MSSIPILEFPMCAKLKLIVKSAMYFPSCPLGALLKAKEFENGKINISPNVMNKILMTKMPAQFAINRT